MTSSCVLMFALGSPVSLFLFEESKSSCSFSRLHEMTSCCMKPFLSNFLTCFRWFSSNLLACDSGTTKQRPRQKISRTLIMQKYKSIVPFVLKCFVDKTPESRFGFFLASPSLDFSSISFLAVWLSEELTYPSINGFSCSTGPAMLINLLSPVFKCLCRWWPELAKSCARFVID